MHNEEQLLRTDVMGRVRTPAARREELLGEFERSGVAATKFAAMVGVKYQTFASWVQKRRATGRCVMTPKKPCAKPRCAVAAPLRLVEAVLAQDSEKTSAALMLHLPGGTRVEMTCRDQAVLVAELIKALEIKPRGSC